MRVLLRNFIWIPLVIGTLMAAILPATAASAGVKAGTTTDETNENWAGYYITYTGPDPNTHPMAVSGAWNIPRVSCTGTAATGEVAAWVGLGGVGTNNLEQIGTTSQCQAGKASYWAWVEAPPAYKPVIRLNSTNSTGKNGAPGVACKGKAPVSPGDDMQATVTDQGYGQFALQIRDTTKRWYCVALWINQSASVVPHTADWVVEDPGDGQWPQFSKGVAWIACTWTQDGVTRPVHSAAHIAKETIVSPTGLTVKSAETDVTSSQSEEFLVTWRHS
jgi:hypothetical protein